MQKSKRAAFSLTELLVFIVLTSACAWIFFPPLLVPRLELNERVAEKMLRTIHAGQHIWISEEGAAVSLARFTREAPPMSATSKPNFRLPLAPVSFRSGPDGSVVRGGYKFMDWIDRSGRLAGCKAVPTPQGYGGRYEFSLRYATGEVKRLPVSP